MTIRPILIHPDPRLRKVADAVETVDDELRALVADMFATMYNAPGIGLAAPQIGVLRRIVVMDCAGRDEADALEAEDADIGPPPEPEPIALINPEIVWASEAQRTYSEGCLSIPNEFEDVSRSDRVRVRWLDAEGAAQEREFGGVRATCVQHEIDHLNGKLFIDYLGPVRRTMITNRMKKLKRERAKEREKAKSGRGAS